MIVVSSNSFSYSNANKTFAADASQLGLPVGLVPTRIGVRSEITGRIVEFARVREQRDREGDVAWWDYAGMYNGTRFAMQVFND